MKITISIEDTDDGLVRVSETREPRGGEKEGIVTPATALAEAMFGVMNELGEVEE